MCRRGNLSFGSKHANGNYVDHTGISNTDDAHTDVTIHHETGSFAGGARYDDPANSQHGMDAMIYKLSEDGVPVSVFAADTLPSDGIYDSSSVHGDRGGNSRIYGLDGFDAEVDMVAGCGYFRGNLTFPMADGSSKTLVNTKNGDAYNGFVTKVNMATNKAAWVTDVGLTHPSR